MAATNKIVHFFALKQSMVALLAMVVLIGLGEKMAERFLPIYLLVRDVIVSIAAFGGAGIWMISPATNLITAFACGLLGTAYFAVYGKDSGRTQGQKPGRLGLNHGNCSGRHKGTEYQRHKAGTMKRTCLAKALSPGASQWRVWR